MIKKAMDAFPIGSRHSAHRPYCAMTFSRCRAVSLLLLAPACAALSTLAARRPIWLTCPTCESEEALARAVPFMLPPRRVQETHLDSNGHDTAGRCLPYSLLLQMQGDPTFDTVKEVPGARDLAAIHQLRDSVLDFAMENQAAAWGQDNCATLGDVIASVAQDRGWTANGVPRLASVVIWANKLKTNPREGCDAAFLFACAARFGLRIHVHYKRESGWLQCTRFAVPTSADTSILRLPRTDVHVGFCDVGDGYFHYVALPPLFSPDDSSRSPASSQSSSSAAEWKRRAELSG